MKVWLFRLLFGAAVLGVIGSAVWNNIATNRLIEQATGTDPAAQVQALQQMAQRDDFFDLIQSRRTPARLRVAEGVERLNSPDAVKIALAMLRDPEPKVRDRFLDALRKIGGNHLEALAEGLKNGDSKVKNGTIQVMSELGLKCLPVALKAFEDSGARDAAGEVLTRFGSASVPGLLKLLRNTQDEGLQLSAISVLGRIGDRRAVDAILPFLKLPPEKRRVVLTALASIADPRTESVLIKALRSPDEDPDARAQAALGLGQMATPGALRALRAGLEDPNLIVADACVSGFQRAGTKALGMLQDALQSQNAATRRRAVLALGVLNDAQAVAMLTRALNDPDATVRRTAADALGTTGHPNAIPALIAALAHPDGGVARNATRSLVKIGAPAIPALIIQLRSPNPTVAYFAAHALSQIPEAEPALLQAAENPATQRYALVALKERASYAAKPLFERAARSEDPVMRQIAESALQQLSQ
ncbi:MAG: HEAT repeat domain-containing protein [Armatimonadetes bacterium]|nr:HEAT repeat domain-containing protein [Armatimonadota bacterium]